MSHHFRQPALWISLGALFFSASGGAMAALVITGSQIKDGTVTGRDIKNGSLTAQDLGGKALEQLAGPAGPAGLTGPAGPAGDRGAVGAKGDAGDIGPRGTKGDAGDRGAPGENGPAGEKGPAGVKGDQGLQGVKGDAGAPGTAGEKGAKGDHGIQGPPGPAGRGADDPLPSGAKLHGVGTWTSGSTSAQTLSAALPANTVLQAGPTGPDNTNVPAGSAGKCTAQGQAAAGYLCIYPYVSTGTLGVSATPSAYTADGKIRGFFVLFSYPNSNQPASGQGLYSWTYTAP